MAGLGVVGTVQREHWMTRPDRFDIFTLLALWLLRRNRPSPFLGSMNPRWTLWRLPSLRWRSSCCASSFAGELAVGLKRARAARTTGGEITQAGPVSSRRQVTPAIFLSLFKEMQYGVDLAGSGVLARPSSYCCRPPCACAWLGILAKGPSAVSSLCSPSSAWYGSFSPFALRL